MEPSVTWTSTSESQGRIFTELEVMLRHGGKEIHTFRFHHQPSSVPCINHVSTPISAKVARYVCTRFARSRFRSTQSRVVSANLQRISVCLSQRIEPNRTGHRNGDEIFISSQHLFNHTILPVLQQERSLKTRKVLALTWIHLEPLVLANSSQDMGGSTHGSISPVDLLLFRSCLSAFGFVRT